MNGEPAQLLELVREGRGQSGENPDYVLQTHEHLRKMGIFDPVLAELAQQLESRRLAAPRTVTDRGIHYPQHYALAGGQRWSNAFSAASKRVLGWSAGGHGLRHSYAQERLGELQRQGLTWEYALETVSQELGHFRPQITTVYLR